MSESTPLTWLSSVKRWTLGRLVQTLSHAARRLPNSTVASFGSTLGGLLYRSSSRYRSVARANLRQAFGGEWSEEQIEAALRETFHNIGKSAVEFLRMPALNEQDVLRLASFEGQEYLDDALARGKGCLILSAHFGNWELMGARLALEGYSLSVIARDADDQGTNRLINWIRESRGYRVLSRDRSLRSSIQLLRRNETLGVLADQNYTTGIFVPFFGKLAATATGPAALVRTTGASMVPCFCIRQPDNTHKIVLRPPLEFQFTDDKDDDIYRMTALLTRAIEDAIREHPTQWLWIHNRWKHRPPEEQASPVQREVPA